LYSQWCHWNFSLT